MRLQELAGGETRTVRVGFDPSLQVTGAAMADMLERRGDKLPLDPDGTISVPIGPVRDAEPPSTPRFRPGRESCAAA